MLPPIKDFNVSNEEEFNQIVHILFETSSVLCKALWQDRPFESYKSMIETASQLIDNMTDSEKVEVVNAHPRIGAPMNSMSTISQKEQGSHHEPDLENTLKELALLNQEYEKKFGFKFVVFVNGRSRAQIVEMLKARFKNTREAEMSTALKAMILIAFDRLSKIK